MVRSINVEPEDNKNIKYLSDKIGKSPIIVVFYMPGCIHCEMLKDPWSKFTNSLSDDGSDSIIAWVHKDVEPKLRSKIKDDMVIQGYPTILGFDKKGGTKEYQGERTPGKLFNFYNQIVSGMKGGSNNGSKRKNKKSTNDMSTVSAPSPPSSPSTLGKKRLKTVVSPLTPAHGVTGEGPVNKKEKYTTPYLPPLYPPHVNQYSIKEINDAAEILSSISSYQGKNRKSGGKSKKKRNIRKKRNTRKNTRKNTRRNKKK